MMSPRVVLHLILYELESRDSHRVKRQVVGPSCVCDRQRRRTHILERRQPRAKDPTHFLVALQVDSANFSSAVVEIEVTGHLLLIGLQLDLRRRLLFGSGGRGAWPAASTKSIGAQALAEVIGHVSPRPEKPLFLAAPQTDPDRASGLE